MSIKLDLFKLLLLLYVLFSLNKKTYKYFVVKINIIEWLVGIAPKFKQFQVSTTSLVILFNLYG